MEANRIAELSEKPAFSLTGGEMADIIISRLNGSGLAKIPVESKKRIKLNGIMGLAKYIDCSVTTAQKMKNEGKFPYYNIGSKVYFYSDEVEIALKNTNLKSK